MSEAPTPQVDVIARPQSLGLVAPQTNPALELASSLQGVNEALGPALQGYAKEEQARLGLKAQQDAMANSGQAFADAVRSGKIEATQNPWYIQAYQEKAAAVRAQGDISQLASDSQTWAERSDPQAFAAKWQQSVGQIAQGYQGIDQAKGFKAAADPLTQQALNTNVEYTAQAIQQANVQNTTALMSKALEDAYKANPKAAPADLYSAIQPFLDRWHGTGGTDADAINLTRGAFESAASSVGNPDLLDALKDDRGGKGAIYNMVGENGRPVSEDIEQTKYRIDRMQNIQGMGAVHALQAQQELEGFKLQAWAYQKYGWDLAAGKIPQDTILKDAQEAGFSPQGFEAFMQVEARDLASNNTYASAQTRQYALTPGNQDTILRLRTEALKSGWSGHLEQEVFEQVRNGMDENVANDILSKADSSSKYFRAEAKGDEREARSEATMNRQMRAQGTRDFKQSVQQSLGQLSEALQAAGDRSMLSNPASRTARLRGATDAGNAWLRQHSDDYTGAGKAADDYLDQYAKQRLALLKANRAGGLAGGVNPRVTQAAQQAATLKAAMAQTSP
jgi:hypothetical protein